jgi:hypothetical protein
MKLENMSDLQLLHEFVELSISQWRDIGDGKSKAANAKISRTDKIAQYWHGRQVLKEYMIPALQHPSEAVRFSAAAYLLRYFADSAAAQELHRLATQSKTLVGPAAEALLRMNKLPING